MWLKLKVHNNDNQNNIKTCIYDTRACDDLVMTMGSRNIFWGRVGELNKDLSVNNIFLFRLNNQDDKMKYFLVTYDLKEDSSSLRK